MTNEDYKWLIQIGVTFFTGGAGGALINNYFINKRKEIKTITFFKEELDVISKPEEDIKIFYKENEIKNLKLFKFEIRNTGNVGLSNVEIFIDMQEGIIVSHEISTPDQHMVDNDNTTISKNQIKVKINVINPTEGFFINFKAYDLKKSPILTCRKENLVIIESKNSYGSIVLKNEELLRSLIAANELVTGLNRFNPVALLLFIWIVLGAVQKRE